MLIKNCGRLLLSFVLLAQTLPAGEVGIYAPENAGGKTLGASAIKKTLAEDAGIIVTDLPSMSLENLLRHRVVIVPNTQKLSGNEDKQWQANLRAYVIACGGALMFYHDAVGAARSPFGQMPLFPELIIPDSVTREVAHKVKVAINPLSDFAYLEGYDIGQTYEHMFNDRFVFLQNSGTALLTDPAGEKTVLAVGTLGKGRLVFNGMLGGNPPFGDAESLEKIDRDVLINTLNWCLSGPSLAVANASAINPAEWRVTDLALSTKHQVALLGNNSREIREHARRNLPLTGIEYDFIPFHQLDSLELSQTGYKLILVMFNPYQGDSDLSVTAFQQIDSYIATGGKAIIFLPAISASQNSLTTKHFLKPLGMERLPTTRDNQDLLRHIEWRGKDQQLCKISGHYLGGGGWFQPISEPTADAAQTIGYWIDYQGEKKYPAIIKTAYGYLSNLNLNHDHSLFTSVAAVELLPEIGAEVVANLKKRRNEVNALLNSQTLSSVQNEYYAAAEKFYQAAETAADTDDYPLAVSCLIQALQALDQTYAAGMSSPTDEERVAFINPREMEVQPDIKLVFERVKKAGFNGLVMNADGRYPSALYPEKVVQDKLTGWIESAHEYGLKFGVVMHTFEILEGTPLFERMRTENWRVVPAESYGKQLPFPDRPGLAGICRSHPEVVDFAVAKTKEVVANYAVDYIVFDVIRWSKACYCDYCKEQFQKDTNLKVEQWPADAMHKYLSEYNDWRARPITRTVCDTSRAIAEIRPNVKLSVFSRQGQKTSWLNGQYWWEWTDYLDFIIPMIYRGDNAIVENLLLEISGLIPAGARAKLLPILAPPGDARAGSNLNHLRQLALQRQYAPTGVMFFTYATLYDDYLDLLRIGPFRQP